MLEYWNLTVFWRFLTNVNWKNSKRNGGKMTKPRPNVTNLKISLTAFPSKTLEVYSLLFSLVSAWLASLWYSNTGGTNIVKIPVSSMWQKPHLHLPEKMWSWPKASYWVKLAKSMRKRMLRYDHVSINIPPILNRDFKYRFDRLCKMFIEYYFLKCLLFHSFYATQYKAMLIKLHTVWNERN